MSGGVDTIPFSERLRPAAARRAQRSKTCRRILPSALQPGTRSSQPGLLAHPWVHALPQEGIVASVQREFHWPASADQLPPGAHCEVTGIDHPEQEGRCLPGGYAPTSMCRSNAGFANVENGWEERFRAMLAVRALDALVTGASAALRRVATTAA